jgi:hypothetical protein
MGDVFVTILAYRTFFPNCAWRAILQICQALQTVAETANHPDARAAAQTAAQEIEVALQQSSALTEVRQELIAAALEHVKDSVCLLAERQ